VSEDPWFRPVDLQLGPDGALYVADFYNRIIGHYEVDRNHPGRDRTRGRIWRIVKSVAQPPRPLNAAERLAQQWRWSGDAAPAGDANAAVKLLADAALDARARLAVAETLAFHPRPGNLEPLSRAIAAADPRDAALRHVLRIALRNQLALSGEFARLATVALPEAELAVVARAVESSDAAVWLLGWLERQSVLPADWSETVQRLAARLPVAEEDRLVAVARRLSSTGGGDAAMLRALHGGFASRGGGGGAGFQQWAREEMAVLLRRVEQLESLAWTSVQPPDSPGSPSPWGIEERPCADGSVMRAVTSLRSPRGGDIERLTGTLRSPEFACPPALAFWLCGHRGSPNTPAHDRTFIRLVDAAGTELARAFPPRNDTAREVRWELATHAGKPVRIELVDGDDATAFAWLAAGRFEPPVVRAEAAIADGPLLELALMMEAFPDATYSRLLARWLGREGVQEATRLHMAAVAGRHAENADALLAAINAAPPQLRTAIAESLAATREGTARLLDAASPRVLAAPAVRARIEAWNDAVMTARLAQALAALPPAAPELDALIAQRARQFARRRAEGKLAPEQGARVFAQSCAACHRIGDVGGLVGPQLDGVKQRGAERLCEDILDPNRDVDPAFRTVHFTLKDDSVRSGLLRSVKPGALLLVDAAGAEHRLAPGTIASRTDSTLSLMPSNFGELLPESDFLDLLAWLMTQ
jgi:putative heme-binding domain-containing protein